MLHRHLQQRLHRTQRRLATAGGKAAVHFGVCWLTRRECLLKLLPCPFRHPGSSFCTSTASCHVFAAPGTLPLGAECCADATQGNECQRMEGAHVACSAGACSKVIGLAMATGIAGVPRYLPWPWTSWQPVAPLVAGLLSLLPSLTLRRFQQHRPAGRRHV